MRGTRSGWPISFASLEASTFRPVVYLLFYSYNFIINKYVQIIVLASLTCAWSLGPTTAPSLLSLSLLGAEGASETRAGAC